jgi:hypothetical protein
MYFHNGFLQMDFNPAFLSISLHFFIGVVRQMFLVAIIIENGKNKEPDMLLAHHKHALFSFCFTLCLLSGNISSY